MEQTISDIISVARGVIITGYPITGIIILAAWLFFAQWRNELTEIISLSNSFLIICGILYIFIFTHKIHSYADPAVYEEINFYSRMFPPHRYLYWGDVIPCALLPQLLWIKGFRQSIYSLPPFSLLLIAEHLAPLIMFYAIFRTGEFISGSPHLAAISYYSYAIGATIYFGLLSGAYLVKKKIRP